MVVQEGSSTALGVFVKVIRCPPLLFLLVMEALSRMLAKAVERGFISSFSVGNSVENLLTITHLLFANDTSILCGANPV